jgi:signal transduction histidine kinase
MNRDPLDDPAAAPVRHEYSDGAVALAMLHIIRATRESLIEADLLSRAARSLRQALACDWTLLTLWDSGRKTFRGAAGDGWHILIEEQLPLAEFGTETIDIFAPLAAGTPVEVPEPPDAMKVFFRQWHVSSLLGVPMMRAAGLVGAIFVGFRRRRGAFSELERRIADAAADHIAVAVESVRALEAVRRTSRLKTDILATMSHELRTPLNAILGYTDLMRDGAMGAINAEQAQALDRILFNGRNVMEMITMALDLNRLEAGRLAVHASEFRLQELIAELSNEFAARPIDNAVDLVWPDHRDMPTLWTDRAMLKVALRNLVNNAVKFTPRGQVAVAVDCNKARGRVRISVSDTGVGIPREQQASIFDMFCQGSSPPRARGGVGLGLYLVRSYTELMGGTVSVESTPGKGSIFTVDLPWRTRGAVAPVGL